MRKLRNRGPEPTGAGNLLDRVAEAATDKDRVSVRDLIETAGPSSFAPLLLLAGLITISPIPGMPMVMGLFVLTIAGQMLFGREHFWLPRWLLSRSLSRDKLLKGVNLLRRPARFFDRISKPRIAKLMTGAGHYAIAAVCAVIALLMPFMELVPFSGNAAGAALAVFGLSLIVRDGVLALIAFGFTAITFGLVIYKVL